MLNTSESTDIFMKKDLSYGATRLERISRTQLHKVAPGIVLI